MTNLRINRNTILRALSFVALASAVSAVGCSGAPGEGETDVEASGGEAAGEAQDPAAGDVPEGEAELGVIQSGLTTWEARRHVTRKLGLPNRFLVGLGNDCGNPEGWDPNRAHAFTLGQKLDIHYMYLTGLDWPTWNSPEGAYVTKHAQAAKSRGVIPMFTLYQAAAWGENNLGAFGNASFMNQYWRNVKTMYKRLGELGSPSIVHLEPDLWGYFQKKGDSPSSVHVKVGSIVPECAGMPEDASGFGKCLIKLGRQYAPKAVLGLSASSFGAFTNGESDPVRIARYLNKVGSLQADFLAVETLDRDAGCFERGSDPLCKRSGNFYWNDAAFRAHLSWAKTLSNNTGRGLIWWQMPLGVPSSSAGYTSHYRDNRVQWLFSHPKEFVDAGGVGAVFGTGAPNQTTAKTDNGQFKNAVSRYLGAATWF